MRYNKSSFELARYGTFVVVGMIVFYGLMALMAGCESTDPEKGYTSRSLYKTDIKTVYVEMFENRSFYREFEFELTRAVCQQLELHSPYKIVSDRQRADTILSGSIRNVNESVQANQRDLDRPMAAEMIWTINITWKDLRSGNFVLENHPVKVSSLYAPFLGSGRQGAGKKIADDAARYVIEAMESPW
jgi:hypothetical protein